MDVSAAERTPDGRGLARLLKLLGPYRALRGNRGLGLLFSGRVVSSLGDWLYITALVILAYTLTRSATVAALLTFVRLLPYSLFIPLGGVLADRFDRKLLMVVADLGRSLCMLGLLFVTSPATLPLAYPLVFVSTCLFCLFRPALKAALPDVVGSADEEDLARANTLMGQIDGIAFVLGPALAGVLALLGHLQVAFALNAVTYLVSAGTLALVRIAPRPAEDRPAEEGGRLAELLAGFTFLFRENDGVLAALTLTVAGVYVFMGGLWALIVVLAETTWRMGAQGAGFLNTAYGVGGLIGGFAVGVATAKLRAGTGFIAATTLITLAALTYGLSPAGVAPFACLAAYGAGDVLQQIFSTTILQVATPAPLLGRVFGAFEAATIAMMLVGALITGPLVGAVGPRGAAVILALVGVAGFLVCMPRLRRLEGALGVRVFLRRVPASRSCRAPCSTAWRRAYSSCVSRPTRRSCARASAATRSTSSRAAV